MVNRMLEAVMRDRQDPRFIAAFGGPRGWQQSNTGHASGERKAQGEKLDALCLATMRAHGRPIRSADLRDAMNIDKDKADTVIQRLCRAGKAKRVSNGWIAYYSAVENKS